MSTNAAQMRALGYRQLPGQATWRPRPRPAYRRRLRKLHRLSPTGETLCGKPVVDPLRVTAKKPLVSCAVCRRVMEALERKETT